MLPPSAPSSVQSPTVQPSASRLPQVVLRADQSEMTARWDFILRVPFGPGRHELTYQPPSQSAPMEPSSFAVAPDGSFWIVDAGKERIAHFDQDGRFLEEVGTPGHHAEDIVFSGASMYALLDEQTGSIAQVRPDGLRSVTVNANGRSLMIFPRLDAPSGGLVARSIGYAGSTGQFEGPAGYVRVDVSAGGQAEILPGLPIGRQTEIRLDPGRSDEEFDLLYLRDGMATAQPVHFELFVGGGSKKKRVPGIFGPDPLPLDGDVPMYVMVSPARSGDQERYGGSRWFLRMGRSPVLWERLPDPGIPDEAQRRHVASGSHGSLYLMVLTKTGASIYRRP